MNAPSNPVIFMRDERLKAEAAIEPDPVSTSPAAKTTQIIAIYGKGGIGKSFTLANLSYMMAQQGKKVLLITGGVKSWSVVSALQEAGLEVVGTSTKKSTKEDKEKIKEIMGDDAHMIDDMTPREMYAMLRDAKADIMLSGGRSQFVALKARMPWMDINQERHHAFAGYEGMVTMVAEIDKALFNPVWREVRSPAPWEVVDPLLVEA